jgi:hypothetical protein
MRVNQAKIDFFVAAGPREAGRDTAGVVRRGAEVLAAQAAVPRHAELPEPRPAQHQPQPSAARGRGRHLRRGERHATAARRRHGQHDTVILCPEVQEPQRIRRHLFTHLEYLEYHFSVHDHFWWIDCVNTYNLLMIFNTCQG